MSTTAAAWDEKAPELEDRGDSSFSMYFNDIEVIVDREFDGKIEVRIWRNGTDDDHPIALAEMTIGGDDDE